MYETDRKIVESITFDACGTFGAIDKARQLLANMGWSFGSMQSTAPIAIARGDRYISKWRNLGSDVSKIEGRIMPVDDFREGGARIEFFVSPGVEIESELKNLTVESRETYS